MERTLPDVRSLNHEDTIHTVGCIKPRKTYEGGIGSESYNITCLKTVRLWQVKDVRCSGAERPFVYLLPGVDQAFDLSAVLGIIEVFQLFYYFLLQKVVFFTGSYNALGLSSLEIDNNLSQGTGFCICLCFAPIHIIE